MSICNARKTEYLKRIKNPYTQDIRITNPNGRNGRRLQIRMDVMDVGYKSEWT